MAISAAGPAAGLCLAAVAWVLSLTTQGYVPVGLSDWLGEWIWINLFWSLFNLIPMFPLDGGSVVLHGLETGMSPHLALRWTRRMSLVVAAAVAYFGWRSDLTFVTIIALMVLLQNFPHRSK
jgi:Zn-dependent protease